MTSIRCHNCGLVNFATLEHCKRCRAVLDQSQPQQSAGLPQVGAWRDRWWLVKHLGVPFDDHCIKCSESADVARSEVSHQPVSVEAESAWSLLTMLGGVQVYRRIDFDVPLCRSHRFGKDKVVLGLMIAGALICLLGMAGMDMSSLLPVVVFMLGFFVIALGFIAHLLRKQIVKVWKYKAPYLWLWGAHRNYLARLPNWSERKP